MEAGAARGPAWRVRAWDRLSEAWGPLVGNGGLGGLWRMDGVVGPRGWGRFDSNMGEEQSPAPGRLQEVRRGSELFKR